MGYRLAPLVTALTKHRRPLVVTSVELPDRIVQQRLLGTKGMVEESSAGFLPMKILTHGDRRDLAFPALIQGVWKGPICRLASALWSEGGLVWS